jgi:hypothetical protein
MIIIPAMVSMIIIPANDNNFFIPRLANTRAGLARAGWIYLSASLVQGENAALTIYGSISSFIIAMLHTGRNPAGVTFCICIGCLSGRALGLRSQIFSHIAAGLKKDFEDFKFRKEMDKKQCHEV